MAGNGTWSFLRVLYAKKIRIALDITTDSEPSILQIFSKTRYVVHTSDGLLAIPSLPLFQWPGWILNGLHYEYAPLGRSMWASHLQTQLWGCKMMVSFKPIWLYKRKRKGRKEKKKESWSFDGTDALTLDVHFSKFQLPPISDWVSTPRICVGPGNCSGLGHRLQMQLQEMEIFTTIWREEEYASTWE